MKSIYEFLLSEHLLNEHLLKSKTTASTQDNDYIDLGLPSGLLWAKCNIGADEPYERGDYFMWGNTEPDTDKLCDWDTAPFNDGHKTSNKEYFESVKNKVCPNDILAPEYDAVTAILGYDLRLPTNDDFKELIDNTTHEWIKNYQGSKINGMLFEANGAALFIPASGYRAVSSFNNRDGSAYLWSSSLDTNNTYCARSLNISVFSCRMYNLCRYYGLCLRGVKEN